MEGFAIDDRMDRYAISQQMVIVNTEKLHRAASDDERGGSSRTSIAGIASEQRQVRAEFVFMMVWAVPLTCSFNGYGAIWLTPGSQDALQAASITRRVRSSLDGIRWA